MTVHAVQVIRSQTAGCQTLNQLVVRFRDPRGADDDAHTRAVTERVIASGECYPSATIWRGVAALRFSLSNWTTDDEDVRRSIAAVERAHRGQNVDQRR